jgi:hypothetical protein
MNLTEVTDLTSIGTLFAFILVSGGIIVLNPSGKQAHNGKGFRVPYADSRRYLLWIWAVVGWVIWSSDFEPYGLLAPELAELGVLGIVRHHFPFLIFALVSILITYHAVTKRWSLIPVLGLLTNLYLMSELGVTNWFRFGIWLAVGLLIYFLYGAKHSRLRSYHEPNNEKL